FKKGDTPVANQEIWYKEGAQGNWKTFKTDESGVAYFGPKDGFTMADLELSEGVETGFKATIAEAGEYTLTVELINAKTYATIDEAGVKTFTVEAPPLAELVVTDAVHDADNKTIAYTFNAEFKLVREFDKPWEIRASELSDANAG